jgi:predicted ATPase/transcriptional regulator with XRE-family HTH domain
LTVIDSDSSSPAFGTLLRRYRLSAGLSQEALAERANLSVEAISTLERGTRRAPYAGTIELLADALDLDRNDRQALKAAVDRRRAPRQPRRLALVSLPLPLTRLVGRERALATVCALIAEHSARLVTITGVGGVGKTHFALELAHSLKSEFEDGAAFVSLSSIRDPAHVASALGQCLERKGDSDAPSFDALCGQIGERHVLLVVDNFEHVLAGSKLVVELLKRCARAAIVVTSREALRVTGEHEFLLPPLELDDAVELLIDRSRAIQPHVDLKPQKDSLVSICRRLDGLPLAIELAAARLRHYPVSALLERLSSRLDVLVAGTRDSPPRQRTMRDAIEWSYQLLSAAEMLLFQIGSLFAGGWTLETIVALAKSNDSANEGVDDVLTSLADKHLISIREGPGGEIRFEMLETIRDYAYEQLIASGRSNPFQRAFAEYYSGLAHRAYPHLLGPDAASWFASIGRDFENFRAALRWAVLHDRSLGLRLALDLDYFWSRGVYRAEAREWFDALVDPLDQTLAAEDPNLMWQATNMLALSHHWVGDEERACELYAEVLQQARKLGDHKRIARTQNNLGVSLLSAGDFERARSVLEESLSMKEQHDDAWSIATTLSNLGLALRGCREYRLALERHGRALDIFRSTDDRWALVDELNDIGDVYRDQENANEAARFYQSSLDANADGMGTLAADSFEGLAAVAARGRQFRQAAVLGGAADSVHTQTGRPMATPDRQAFDAACSQARAALGADPFAEAWAEGAALSLPEAIEVARAIASDLCAT